MAWGLWMMVRMTQRDEARLCALAQSEARTVARRVVLDEGEAFPTDAESWRDLLADHMPRLRGALCEVHYATGRLRAKPE